MNDETLRELKIVIERAVRPVRASMARRRKMREELLAHLVSIFEEEASHGDEQAALERTQERFGDPRELSRQLQQTVLRFSAGLNWMPALLTRMSRSGNRRMTSVACCRPHHSAEQ